MQSPLLQPYTMGNLTLRNRVVMAPLTRSRAPGQLANELMAEYYGQRASAGLIISEGSQVSPMGVGYPDTPGIHTPGQTHAWRQVTDAVHNRGGAIFIQLWHVGALSHPYFLGGQTPLSASAVTMHGDSRTPEGPKTRVAARPMTTDEIRQTITEFVRAAQNAFDAGFDGAEVHSSNGYLFHQFFAACTNHRTDNYGGSIENRTRILFELIEELGKHVPLNRIGFRFNPLAHDYHSMVVDEQTIPTFDYIMRRLNDYPIAYVHLSEPFTDVSAVPHTIPSVIEHYRKIYHGTLMANTRFTFETGNRVIQNDNADLVAFGIPFISNPDLVERFATGAAIAEADRSTFYTSGAMGYTDYPTI